VGGDFSDNLTWKWTQAGVNILHLGTFIRKKKILMVLGLVPSGAVLKATREEVTVVKPASPKAGDSLPPF